MLAPGSPEDTAQLVDVRDLAACLVDLAEARADGVLHALRTTPGAPVIGLSRAEEAEVLTARAATRGASGRGHGA